MKTPPRAQVTPKKSPEKAMTVKTPEIVEHKYPQKQSNSIEKLKLKLELKLERKKSPKKFEKPKVNIFLEDSDEVDEFESVVVKKSKWSSPPEEVPPVRERKTKWSSPIPEKELDILLKSVPAPVVEPKRKLVEIPVVIESPERSPVIPASLTDSIFDSSKISIQKSPTPSPPPRPSNVRNVCSFLSDIASGSIFSGLGLGSGLYDDNEKDKSIVGLKLDDYKVDKNAPLIQNRKLENTSILENDRKMEPDTTVDKAIEKSIKNNSDSDDSDSDTSSSSDSDSDDTTSESEESSEESSDDEIPTFTRGFGRFDASSMPMVTQIKPTAVVETSVTEAVSIASRFQSIKTGLPISINKPAFYSPSANIPTAATPFSVLNFPIPFKIYSLRDNTNCQMTFPSPVQPVAVPTPTVSTPSSDKSEKDRKTFDKDKREKDRKRSRSRSHSRDRDKKRLNERKKTSPRRRTPSPARKRHIDERSRQVEDRKDSRRIEPSPRHSSHNSRSSHSTRFVLITEYLVNNFFNIVDILGIVHQEGSVNQDHELHQPELDRLLVREHRHDQGRLLQNSEDRRRLEEVFQEVHHLNTEEARAQQPVEEVRLLQTSAEAREDDTAPRRSSRIAIAGLLRLIIGTTADPSRHHSARRWTRPLVINQILLSVIRNWRDSSTCRKSFILRNGTILYRTHQSVQILMTESIECSLIRQLTQRTQTFQACTRLTLIHIQCSNMTCKAVCSIPIPIIRCHHRSFTFNLLASHLII